MKKPSDISVCIVIPAYNEEADIGACLEAIARQTVMPDEVILVDNNSSDGTVEIAKGFPFVRVVHEKQQGIVHARDRGFDASKSDIIGRIDADSRLRPGWVEAVKRYYHAPEHANRAVSGRGYYYNLRWPMFAGMLQHDIAFGYNKLILGGYILWGSNMAIPRKVWQNIRHETCLRGDIHEDIDLAIHLFRHGYKVDYRRSMVVGVRMRRIHTERTKLWPNLMLWPQTFRAHGYRKWPLAHAGAVFLYIAAMPLRWFEHFTSAAINRPRRVRNY